MKVDAIELAVDFLMMLMAICDAIYTQWSVTQAAIIIHFDRNIPDTTR